MNDFLRENQWSLDLTNGPGQHTLIPYIETLRKIETF